ncbi:putative MIF4G-like, type 3, MIF4G-like domain superfamily protein [Helianthus anomalus]
MGCIKGEYKRCGQQSRCDKYQEYHPGVFSENLIRGRPLFRQACLNSQRASPGSSDVYAALVVVVNAKFPQVGVPLLQMAILRFQMAYKRSNKDLLLVSAKFIAHLVNQQVVHELIALELVTLLLKNQNEDRVEVAIDFQCGSKLQDLSPQGLHGIFECFQRILDEGEIDKSLIEGLFALRKTGFQGHPAIRPKLDLVRLGDQVTHKVSLHVR